MQSNSENNPNEPAAKKTANRIWSAVTLTALLVTAISGMKSLSGDDAFAQATKAGESGKSEKPVVNATGPAVTLVRSTSSPIKIEGIPPVLFTEHHAKLCTVQVGMTMPELELKNLKNEDTKLSSLFGKQSTVVVFWEPNQLMTRMQLEELATETFTRYEAKGVRFIGIAVGADAAAVEAELEISGSKLETLLDTDQAAFAKVGTEMLPRTFLLDSTGKVLWLDIEFSLATRRELLEGLHFLTEEKE